MASDDMEFSRRWKRFIVTPECFGWILLNKASSATWFPSDAKLVGFYHDASANAITVFLESETYPITRFGDVIPIEVLKVEMLSRLRN